MPFSLYSYAAQGIRRITEHETGTRLEFAVGAWEDREILAYQPPNTTITLGNITYDDFGRTSDDPDFGSHFAKPAPYLIETRENAVLGYRYVYGADGRLDAIECGGARLEYDYWPETNLISQARWRNQGEAAPFLAVNRYYDDYRRLYRIDLDSTQIIGYQLNDDDQRTRTQLPDASVWDYTYDTMGQLVDAERSPVPDHRTYAYDGIGNRTEAEEDGAATTYAANLLNQYTAVNAEEPAYDADGNLLTWNGWTYTWDSENRLVAMEKGDIRVEADYDYMGRRFEKKVFENNTLTKHQRFVYDGYKLIAVYDALNGNALEATFLWQPIGMDVPLAATINGETYYYVTDGNKNVLKLLRADGTEAATYDYGPFGQTLNAAGPLAELNPFRFSSEYHDNETGLVYYNYRYYHPGLGRWLSRDPAGEEGGGANLYVMVRNSSINYWDINGLATGEVLWVVYIPTELERDRIVIPAINCLADLHVNLKTFFPPTSAIETHNLGRIAKKKEEEYLKSLQENYGLADICWDRVYATRFTMDEKQDKIMALNTNIDALGYGNNWKAILYYTKIKRSWLAAREEGKIPDGAIMERWIFVATMHEVLHSVGVSHLSGLFTSAAEEDKVYPRNLWAVLYKGPEDFPEPVMPKTITPVQASRTVHALPSIFRMTSSKTFFFELISVVPFMIFRVLNFYGQWFVRLKDDYFLEGKTAFF